MKTIKKRVRVRETSEYIGFARRVIRAAGKRVADGDATDLKALYGLQKELKLEIETGISGLRKQGFTWSDIARAIGIKTQSAWERWKHVDSRDVDAREEEK